jgi:hypothetical protein
VTCRTCRSPDTDLVRGENRLYFVTCNVSFQDSCPCPYMSIQPVANHSMGYSRVDLVAQYRLSRRVSLPRSARERRCKAKLFFGISLCIGEVLPSLCYMQQQPRKLLLSLDDGDTHCDVRNSKMHSSHIDTESKYKLLDHNMNPEFQVGSHLSYSCQGRQ